MDQNMPFTPPPYYVPPKSLPKRNPTSQNSGGESSIARQRSLLRQGSNRVQKNKSKRKKPGLSINTNVTRPGARPQEIQIPQVPVLQPPHSNSPAWQLPAQNSPTRFPTSYLDVSRRNTLRKSEVPENLYFAPPPGSSAYSKPSSRSSSRGKRVSRARESVASYQSSENGLIGRAPSNAGFLYMDDGRTPDSANTMTSHRSRGWWNVITTPFENARISQQMGIQLDPNGAPAVPAIPAQYAAGSAAAVSRNNTQASVRSAVSSTLSPNDRVVPILFAGSPIASHHSSLNTVMENPVAEPATSPEQQQNDVPRMPFQATGRTPPTAQVDFSPGGVVAGQGTVGAAPTIVNVVIHQGQSAQVQEGPIPSQQSSESRVVPDVTIVSGQQRSYAPMVTVTESSPRNTIRRSFQNTIVKTVRFLTPRTSRAVEPGISSPPSNRSSTPDTLFNPPSKRHFRGSGPSSIDTSRSKSKSLFSIFRRNSNKSEEEDDIEMPYYVFYADDKQSGEGTESKRLEKRRKKKPKEKKTSRRRTCCICCCILLLLLLSILGLILGLAIGLTHRKHGSSITWVNITNYPGVPIGELTISRPNMVSVQSGCVSPSTMWSCDVPPEQQQSIQPNDADQPNFTLSIVHSTQGQPTPTSSPTPPTAEDEAFLGNTTDGNSAPFEGETTPFYISFVSSSSANQTSSNKVKRQSPTTTGSSASTVIPNIATAIPRPSLNPDGTPEPADLLPFPSSQPLRIFNRGQSDEYLGFYTYFDRNIYLKSDLFDPTATPIPADANGGSTQLGANFICTWTQTRYLVQIWTQKNSTTLLSKEAGNRPGTFPYPVTITLDRHGGEDTIKSLFCWGLQVNGQLNQTERKFQVEDRAFNGTIINPSTGPFSGNGPNVTLASGGPGGIDGGTGGCHCKWQNF